MAFLDDARELIEAAELSQEEKEELLKLAQQVTDEEDALGD
jgi:hypothetical protein